VYKKICDENLILVMHTGFDFAFSRIRIADPEKIITVIEKFPSLKLVTTHLGAWEQWDEVEQFLLGKNIYMEISFSLEFLDDAVKKIISNHPQEYILFGTDSPWTEQQKTLSLLRSLQLGEEKEALILRENAEKLLNSV
ncbi:MAG: amidohydrolase family protein, partial [Thermodesulfovibrionales bacterium]|nr:amidohydrolase family protein [Thermodesulfovibrionales bacterium]